MKQLYLLRSTRHRISEQSKLSDYHHPLTRRGELAAISIGRHMTKKAYMPDLVICASPTRTRQTLAYIYPKFTHPPELIHDFRIHLMRGDALLERLHQIGEKFSRVLIISIAPGICDLAELINKPLIDTPGAPSQELAPGTLAVFNCDISSWAELSPASASLVETAIGGIF